MKKIKRKKRILILYQKRKFLPLISNTLSKWGSVKDINTIIYAILLLYLFTDFDWTFLHHVT